MDTSMHGRRVEYFQVQSEGNTVRPVGPGEGSLVLSATFNGDRDEFQYRQKQEWNGNRPVQLQVCRRNHVARWRLIMIKEHLALNTNAYLQGTAIDNVVSRYSICIGISESGKWIAAGTLINERFSDGTKELISMLRPATKTALVTGVVVFPRLVKQRASRGRMTFIRIGQDCVIAMQCSDKAATAWINRVPITRNIHWDTRALKLTDKKTTLP